MADEPAGPAARRLVDIFQHAPADVGGDVPSDKNFPESPRPQEYCSLAAQSTSPPLSKEAESGLSVDHLPTCSANAERCAQEPSSTSEGHREEQDTSRHVHSRNGIGFTDERHSRDSNNPIEQVRREKGDEEEKSSKIGDAIKLEEDVDRGSLGDWGKKIRPDVVAAFPMYEASPRADGPDDEVVRRYAIFAEDRTSREGLCRRGETRKELPCEKTKVPRSRSRYKQSPRDEADTQRALSKRRRGNRREGRQRVSPDITLVHDVVDNLIQEFEAQPIIKKPPLPHRSSSPRRGDRSPPRRTSPARTRSSPVRGPKRSSPRGSRAGSRLKSYVSTVVRSRSSSDQPDDKELERVWTVCSLLESITGDVTTEARRVYEPRGDTSQTKNRAASGNADPDQVSEYASQDYVARKSKHAPRRNRAKSKQEEKTKARKMRRKSMEKSTNGNYRPKARHRSASKHKEAPENDDEPERAEKKNKGRGRSRQRLRHDEEFESDKEPDIFEKDDVARGRSRQKMRREEELENDDESEGANEKSRGKYRAQSRQRMMREEELEGDELEPMPNRSKRFKRAKAEEGEAITEADTSATEISVEDVIETDEAADMTAKERARTPKKRKVRFFTNLVFRRRHSPAVEPSLSEPHVFPRRKPRENLWRQHDEAVFRTSSDGILDADIETSQDEEWSNKQNVARRCSSSKVFFTIKPRRKPRRVQDDSEDGHFSKVSKVEGVAIEVDPSTSEGDESPRQPKRKYYCEAQNPSHNNDGQDLATEHMFVVDRSTPKGLVVRSQSSSAVCGNSIEVGTVQTCPSFEEPCQPLVEDDDQPLFRARIGRRSAMPPDEPAEDEEDVHLLTARIGRRSNPSVTGSFTRAASIICADDGKNLHRILSDDISITPAAQKRPSRSISIDLELPREWSLEPRHGETTAPASVSAVMRRPHRHRRSHWSRSRSRSRHRRHRYGRPLCNFRRSSQMSHTVQFIRAAPVPPYQYMCAQPPTTQVYTSLSAPAPPPLYPLPMVPPACMEPNLRLENRSYRRPPPPWAFRRQPPPYMKETIISQQELSQMAPAPVTAASRATTNTSFATALDTELSLQQRQQQQPTLTIFQGNAAEGPSVHVMVPAEAAAPETVVTVEPPDQTLVCVTATPATSARRSDSTACPRLSTSTEIRPSSVAQSVDAVHFAESSHKNDSSSSGSHVETVWEARILDDWEQEKPPPVVKSTDLIIPRENRFYGNLVKNLPQRGHGMLYIILLVGILVGTAAIFSTYARRHARRAVTEIDSDTEGSGQQPWMSGPWVNGDAAKMSCFDPSCISEFAQLSRSLDSTVNPCQNFYGHVCSVRRANGTVDEQMTKKMESYVVGFFQGIGSPDKDLPVASASRRLWKDCVDLATLNKLGRAPLQALLNLTGLGGWPYIYGTDTGRVWRTAGRLQRLMGLAPLVGLVALPDGAVQLVPGDQGTVEADDVLDSMLALRRNNSHLRDLAADVADLGRRLSGLRERYVQSDSADVQQPQLFVDTALEGLQKPGAVQVAEAGLLNQYVLLMNKSSSRTVLNLLGYRLVRHVDILTPAAVKVDLNSGASSRRESACARMVLEYALTTDAAEYVRYASLRSHMDFDLVRSTTAQLKRVLASRLSDLRWMDGGTRKSALARLRELKVRFFFDRYEGSNESAQARWPSALPSQALTTYQRFREARFRSQLSQGDDVSGAQQQCTYDVGYKVLFLRLSVVDVREPESPAWPAFQAARLSPRLARCLLHVLLQRVRWSAASRSRLDALRSRGCGDVLADRGALEPAKSVFDTQVRRLGRGVNNTPSWDKMFYLVYANSMCEDPDHQRKSHQHDGAHWERVNKALSNDATFQKAFKCHLQNNNSACSFWGTR